MGKRRGKIYLVSKAVAMLCTLVFLLSAAMAPTFGWQDYYQHKTNEFAGGYKYTSDTPTEKFSDLTITKAVESADGGAITQEQHETEFEFTVTFGDGKSHDYCIDGNVEKTVADGGKIYLKHGETAVFKNLPPGLGYYVAEGDYTADGYTAAVGEYTGTIVSPGETRLPFVNLADTGDGDGSLTVTKTVTGKHIDPDQEFAFMASFTGDGSPSPQSFVLKHGESITFDNLPKGTSYTVTEENADGYAAAITTAHGIIAGGHTTQVGFINYKFHSPAGTTLTIEKIVAGNPPTRERDRLFTFSVLIDGVEIDRKILLRAGDESDPIPLPEGAAYEVLEDDYSLEGYTQSPVENGYGTAGNAGVRAVATNIWTGDVKITVSGEKTWDLRGHTDVTLPESITILLTNGDKTAQTAIVEPDKDGKWTYSFTAPKYESDGETEIVYTIEEAPVNSFAPTVDGTDIKNTYIPPVATNSVKVTKVWVGKNHSQPDSVQVQLYKAGEVYGEPVALNAENNWTHIWSGLEENALWTVGETTIAVGYTKTVTGNALDGFTIINSIDDTSPVDGTVTISGIKTWSHGSNPESERPDSITVYAKIGEQIAAQKAVTADSNWRYSFELPKYTEDGTLAEYTIEEDNVPHYTCEADGYNLTNIYKGMVYSGDSPKAGDASNVRLWFAVMLISAGSFAATLIIGRRWLNINPRK